MSAIGLKWMENHRWPGILLNPSKSEIGLVRISYENISGYYCICFGICGEYM